MSDLFTGLTILAVTLLALLVIIRIEIYLIDRSEHKPTADAHKRIRMHQRRDGE